jgi:hypothetical protein
MPEASSKKNAMRKQKRERSTCGSGPWSGPEGPVPGSSPGAGG